jgi:hypothetical protein
MMPRGPGPDALARLVPETQLPRERWENDGLEGLIILGPVVGS